MYAITFYPRLRQGSGALGFNLVVVLALACSSSKRGPDEATRPHGGQSVSDGGGSRIRDGSTGDSGNTSDAEAIVTGAIDGASFEPKSSLFGFNEGFSFVFTHLRSKHQEVTITDFADTCGNNSVVGRMLYFALFQALAADGDTDAGASSSDATVSRPGVFHVWAPSVKRTEIPTGNVAIVSYYQVGPLQGHGGAAQSGTVKVIEVDGDHISATFDLTFNFSDLSEEPVPDDRLTGSFNASRCDSWSRSASVP